MDKVQAWLDSDIPWRPNVMGGPSHRVEDKPAPVPDARVKGYRMECGGTRQAARQALRASERAELAAEAEAIPGLRADLSERTKAALALIVRIGTGR